MFLANQLFKRICKKDLVVDCVGRVSKNGARRRTTQVRMPSVGIGFVGECWMGKYSHRYRGLVFI